MKIPLKRPRGTWRDWSEDSTGSRSLSLGSFLLAGLLILDTQLDDPSSEADNGG